MVMKMLNETRGNRKGEPTKYLPAGSSSLKLCGWTSDFSCSLSVSDSILGLIQVGPCRNPFNKVEVAAFETGTKVLGFESLVTHLFKNSSVLMHIAAS